MPVWDAYLQLLEATGPGAVGRFFHRLGPSRITSPWRSPIGRGRPGPARARCTDVDQAPRPRDMGTRIAFIHPASCQGLPLELVEFRCRPSGSAAARHREVAAWPRRQEDGGAERDGIQRPGLPAKVTDWVYEEVKTPSLISG